MKSSPSCSRIPTISTKSFPRRFKAILCRCSFFFFQAEDGIRDWSVTGVQTCALPIWAANGRICFIGAPREGDPDRRDTRDRKSVGDGKSVDLGGRRIIKKKIRRWPGAGRGENFGVQWRGP